MSHCAGRNVGCRSRGKGRALYTSREQFKDSYRLINKPVQDRLLALERRKKYDILTSSSIVVPHFSIGKIHGLFSCRVIHEPNTSTRFYLTASNSDADISIDNSVAATPRVCYHLQWRS